MNKNRATKLLDLCPSALSSAGIGTNVQQYDRRKDLWPRQLLNRRPQHQPEMVKNGNDGMYLFNSYDLYNIPFASDHKWVHIISRCSTTTGKLDWIGQLAPNYFSHNMYPWDRQRNRTKNDQMNQYF